MSLPVSQYEALLAQVRGLRQQAQHVQQLADPLLLHNTSLQDNEIKAEPLDYTMDTLLLERQLNTTTCYDGIAENDSLYSEEENGERQSTRLSVSSEPISQNNRGMSVLYHGTWPVERTMWNSEPTSLGPPTQQATNHLHDVTSVMSFASSSGGVPLDRVLDSPDRRSSQQLEAKVDMVYSLLAMLGGQEHADMGETLLALSTNPESCLAMRQSGCIPLLVQLVQSDRDAETRKKASKALHNLVHSQPDEKLRKRETRIFKLLENVRAYSESLRNDTEFVNECSSSEDGDRHPIQTIAHVMKLSFDEGHRQAICQLGGIHTIADLIEAEHSIHGSTSDETHCILMRRYACMALTNLTFGDSGNKALLCSFRDFIRALVVQLQSPSDELRQVTASVLRNLSWRADSTSKEILKEVGSVTGLMKSAMLDNKENTLKSILSALWNLSAHCTENKSEICAVDGALAFLVDMLMYKTISKSLAIIENSGGILRNISSQIAVRDDYREILRRHNCLQILLDQLKSPSLTIVSNACGTLWNLSAKNPTDQELLWQMGAPTMLKSLNHSKHKMIAMGSSAALKNLLSARPTQSLLPQLDATALSLDLPVLPTLGVRKQKALLKDLDLSLAETFDNIGSPKESLQKMLKNKQNQRESSPSFLKRTTTECVDHLNNSFASLNMNEPSTSFDGERRSRIPQSCGSSSLPYMGTGKAKTTYAPPSRNDYSESNYEDVMDAPEEPYDFSRKYSETKLPKSIAVTDSSERTSNYKYEKIEVKTENFGIYAETDLDQPTDYSLRYAEDDSESDDCSNISKGRPEFVQDTIKTYCTEGTPYETPLNFSTATSMSDLRIDDKGVIDNDKLSIKEAKIKEVTASIDEKDHCSTEDISDLENRQQAPPIKVKSEFSSGMMSPEKPVNYCDEGTPGYFSRVSSYGSLNSIPVNEPMQKELKKTETRVERNDEKKVELPQKPATEIKAVKFESNVNYAEETPLMFSRSSSLASLDSIEQHSIHDDRSSVISDFSRLTSGIVSPSELPDSPTQTVPPSPKPRKNALDYPSSSRIRTSLESRPQPAPRTLPKSSVFEDNVTKFKEENTPVQFSTATSLSSLTIDDQDDAQILNIPKQQQSVEDNTLQKDEPTEKQDVGKEKAANVLNDDLSQVSEDEGDEDILAACISDGMQNNRHNQSIPTTSKLPMSNYKYQTKPNIINKITSDIPLTRVPTRNVAVPTTTRVQKSDVNIDTVRTYCTEDTPAILSHAGSNSDLSNLSITTNESKPKKDYLSDDSSNLSGENDNILAECIQSGMPKAKKEINKPSSSRLASALPRRSLPTSTPIKFNATNAVQVGNARRERLDESCKVQGRDIIRKTDGTLPSYLTAIDETASYAVENSPHQFSSRSSLSDLTVDSSVAGPKKSSPNKSQTTELETAEETESANTSKNVEQNELSRKSSLSSISIESFGSLEAEQALLDQCISSGMPKSKHNVTPIKPQIDNCEESNQKDFLGKSDDNQSDGKSKNVNVASVARYTIQINNVYPNIPAMVADVEKNPKILGDFNKTEKIKNQPQVTTVEHQNASIWSIDENLVATKLTKSGSNKSLGKILDTNSENISSDVSLSNSDNCTNYNDKNRIDRFERSCTESSKVLDTRMLDPDAMIESLDRFTAELISQASSHLQNKSSEGYKNDSIWDENTSTNDVTFPSISGSIPNVVTFKSDDGEKSAKLDFDVIDGPPVDQNNGSNDFSSINTSTMTESTLIAIEATKMVTAFRQEAEMSSSVTSVASLELDRVEPPSHLNSMSNSMIGPEFPGVSSPKLPRRKKSLPASVMIRRVLTNLPHASSTDSLENQNLVNFNTPGDVSDMQGSLTSVESLPIEYDFKSNFVINGSVGREYLNFSSNKNPSSMLNLLSSQMHSISDLENINPPSLFNEITDLCNSLADVATSAICSETEVFEDCVTHIGDSTLQTENDFSDANSVTPIQSDINSSSSDTTPKRTRHSNRHLKSKQRRLAKERYKTYTVAAEMVMKDQPFTDLCDETFTQGDDYKTVNCLSEEYKSVNDATFVSPAYSVKDTPTSKVTPKERRLSDRSRFQTQVLDVGSLQKTTNMTSEPITPTLIMKQNFAEQRIKNKDRFKTQTLEESVFTPTTQSSPINSETDIHLLVEKEANKVLKTLREIKTNHDEFIDCETLSLVSNDDESEHNSGSSMNYRTYHKSWGFRQNTPVIPTVSDPINCDGNLVEDRQRERNESEESENENNVSKIPGKPKIVKPEENKAEEEIIPVEDETSKGIRGRRKQLYSKSNLSKPTPKSSKPIKTTITSNLVKNVTNSFKSGNSLKSVVSRPRNVTTKPPVPRTSSGYGTRPVSAPAGPRSNSCIGSPARTSNSSRNSLKLNNNVPKQAPSLERQGTFTKDDVATPPATKSKIPGLSKIPTFGTAPSTNKSPARSSIGAGTRNGIFKSASSDRTNKNIKTYSRSTSADSRESALSRKIQSSTSSQSLKSELGKVQNGAGAIKKSASPASQAQQHSSSSSSLNSNGSSSKKQVTSRIASLWKKIEHSKQQPAKNDKKVWIKASQPETEKLVRSNTFDNKEEVILRNKKFDSANDGTQKRISRLGSFIVMDGTEEGARLQQVVSGTANN